MRKQGLAPVSRIAGVLLVCGWMASSGAIPSILFPSVAQAADDAGQIRALIGATWDQPDRKVETNPVVVSGSFAIASWTQSDRGGRALLRNEAHAWRVVLCSGDPLTQAEWLVVAGVPEADATVLARRLAEAEAKEAPVRREKFSLFEGTVMGDALEHRHPAPQHRH